MNSEATKLIDLVNEAKVEVERVGKRLSEAEINLRNYQGRCRHNFTERYDPIIHPGGYDPGDPPGTMGVDQRGPTSWPETREDRWRRDCNLCGLTEYTKIIEEEVKKKPKWPT